MREVSPQSPEARLKRKARAQARGAEPKPRRVRESRAWKVIKRIAIGVYSDGFIHAGNLAYLALLSLFPFVIVAAAIARLAGHGAEGMSAVNAILQTMPHDVQQVLRAPIADVLHARNGNLLWFGAIVGLWTTASFIETVRDVIRRSYGVTFSRPFWEYRLGSIGIIIISVVMAMIAFSVSVLLSGAQRFIIAQVPAAADIISLVTLVQIVPALLLFGSLYLLFYILTPKRYRAGCRKWLIALIFFFIIGLGLVIGAELNAALAETPRPNREDVEAAVHEQAAEVHEQLAVEKAVRGTEEEME